MAGTPRTGKSTTLNGTITGSTASLLTFAQPVTLLIISNNSGAPMYLKLNDAAPPTVSTTVFDVVLPTGSYPLILQDVLRIENVSVYCTATTLLMVAGW